jgi:hypothetical protein
VRLTGKRCSIMRIQVNGGVRRRVSRCGGCGEYFSRASNFDKHRTGPYGDRRCMAPAEMLAAGLRLVDGVWKGPPKLAHGELQTTSLKTNREVEGT